MLSALVFQVADRVQAHGINHGYLGVRFGQALLHYLLLKVHRDHGSDLVNLGRHLLYLIQEKGNLLSECIAHGYSLLSSNGILDCIVVASSACIFSTLGK